MPEVDINLKRGQKDARKDIVDFWNQGDNFDNLLPLKINEEDRWGVKPDTQTDIIIPIGKNENGYNLFDFNFGYNLLAGGSMLSGAGMFRRVSFLHLIKEYTPKKVKIVIIDSINQMSDFDDIPHLIFPRATKQEDVIKALNWCNEESDRRFNFLESRDKERSILNYNRHLSEGEEIIPDIFIFISELGDVVSNKDALKSIIQTIQISRATSIHFIITTQRPSIETIPDILKDNFFNRIAFQMPYKEESELFIGKSGAEELLGQGDMLFVDSNNDKIHHLQGLYFPVDGIKDKVKELIKLNENI